MEVLIEKGIVVSKLGNRIKIAVPKKPECDTCMSLLCHRTQKGENLLELESEIDINVGETVEVQLFGKQLVKVTTFLYLLPLVILVVSISILMGLTNNAIFSVVISFALLGIYYLVLRRTKFVRTKPKIFRVDNIQKANNEIL
ncbi:MAG: SoxR reducing system RseC family protein [Ignavibacteria bacterium]|nr:SoxR reducing system RseC family protein [Ignavibacteria bacterium]